MASNEQKNILTHTIIQWLDIRIDTSEMPVAETFIDEFGVQKNELFDIINAGEVVERPRSHQFIY